MCQRTPAQIKQKNEYMRVYNASTRGRAVKLKHSKTAKCKATARAWALSDVGRAAKHRCNLRPETKRSKARWAASARGVAKTKQYLISPRGKAMRRKAYEKYYRVRGILTRKRPPTWRKKTIEEIKAANKLWKKVNAGRVAAYTQNRNALKLQATPPWVNLSEIFSVYTHAARLQKQTGVRHHVHHIYPLKDNPAFTGLHVPWNLKVVTADEHRRLHLLKGE